MINFYKKYFKRLINGKICWYILQLRVFKMNHIKFNLNEWVALSPGLISQQDWGDWSKNNCLWPVDLVDVPANLIKPIMRRRMSSLSKLALQAALQLSSEKTVDYIVFSSRHGELTRTVKLIEDIMKGEEASPMSFSQSVHNTAAGLFTICSQRATPVTSIAAVESTLHHAFIEAAVYLQENPSKQVLVVDFDEPLPTQYAHYEHSDRNYHGYAFAALLSFGDNTQISWSKNSVQSIDSFPQSLSIIDFLIQQKRMFSIHDQRLSWSWRR